MLRTFFREGKEGQAYAHWLKCRMAFPSVGHRPGNRDEQLTFSLYNQQPWA